MAAYSLGSPEDVERRRAYAQALLSEATSGAPVGHWMQALARVIQAGTAGYEKTQASKLERQGRAGADKSLFDIPEFKAGFGSSQPKSEPDVAPVAPPPPAGGPATPSAEPVPNPNAPIHASIKQRESGGNPAALSPKGAQGLMQVMPDTARDPGFGVTPAKYATGSYDASNTGDVAENERVGKDVFDAWLKRYNGDLDAALVAYNWGPKRADKWMRTNKKMPLPAETQQYIVKVKEELAKRQQVASAEPARVAGPTETPPVPDGAVSMEAAAKPPTDITPPTAKPETRLAQDDSNISPELLNYLNNPWASEAGKAIAGKLLAGKFMTSLEKRKLEAEIAKLEREAQYGEGTDDTKELGPINEARTKAGLKPYRLDEWIEHRTEKGATKMFEDDPAKLWRMEAIKGSNPEYKEIAEQARTATNTKAYLDVLMEVIKLSPQAPVPGRIAKMFPDVTSAGAAVTALVKALAPTLRVTGSGSTSDMEFDAMLASLPGMSNYPEANALIGAAMSARNQIALDRGAIANDMMRGRITLDEYYESMQAVNTRSILTPQLREMIEATSGKNMFDFLTPKSGQEKSDDDLKKELDELKRQQGGAQ